MIQGLDPSEDVYMQSHDSPVELRFAKTFPQDRPTIVITDASIPHDDDIVQLVDSTTSKTTTEAHV